MTLPASGTISMSQVSVELGRASNYGTSLGESAVRTLAGVPSGTIGFNNLHGKSNFAWRDNVGDCYEYAYSGGATSYLSINRNGTTTNGDWGLPTGGTPGDGWQVYFELLSQGGSGSFGGTFGSWLALSSDRYVYAAVGAPYGQVRSHWGTVRVHFYRNSDAWQTSVDVYVEATADYSDI